MQSKQKQRLLEELLRNGKAKGYLTLDDVERVHPKLALPGNLNNLTAFLKETHIDFI